MSQKTIGEIYVDNPADPLDGTELFEVEQGGESAGATGVQVAQMVMPAGMFGEFGNVAAPDGWLACDGAAVSRATYAALFAAIGEVWGVGDGLTTFNVPDRRGTIARGTGSHGTETMANGNPFAGPAVGAFEDDQMQGHYHKIATENNTPLDEISGGDGGIANDTIGQATGAGSGRTKVLAPRDDGTYGTPRSGDETRGFAAGVLICIKT